jgi:hypothetical protein
MAITEPSFTWPESGVYKVVQLSIDGKPLLAFGNIIHGNILASVLRKFGIEYKLLENRLHERVPAIEGEHYKVLGAGKAAIDAESKKAYFWDISGGYGIGINEEHVNEIRKLYADWAITSDPTKTP